MASGNKIADHPTRALAAAGKLPTMRQPPNQGDGGGGDMEGRVAALETHVEHIREDIAEIRVDLREIRSDMRDMRGDMRTDFRVLFGALIALGVGLAGLMAHGFKWI